MPVELITIHTHGSWLADREEGFHERKDTATRAPNPPLGAHQRSSMKRPERVCDDDLQQLCISSAREAAPLQRVRLFAVGSVGSHLHWLLGWDDDRAGEAVRRSLKRSLSLDLQTAGVEGPFFSKGGDCYRLLHLKKFRFHRFAYLPDHPGWFFDAERGLRAPKRGQRLVERWRLGELVPSGGFAPGSPKTFTSRRADS